MPIDVERVISVLRESAVTARKPRAITYANLAFAYTLTGDIDAAIEAATTCCDLVPEENVWLWGQTAEGKLELLSGMNTSRYAQDLLDRIKAR
jgi:hypothetical protein